MAINLGAIRDLLLPGLADVYGNYDMIPAQWDKVFDVRNSHMANERAVEMRYLGLAQLKAEGQQLTFDNNAGEVAVYNQEHITIALGYAITRETIEDNLYKAQFKESNLGLRDSFLQTKEIYGANVLNTGSTYNPVVGGDGVALFSTSHPVAGGTVGNRPAVDMDLGEAALLSAMISIRTNFKNAAGLKINARARKLIIPPALEPVAIRLTKTELRPGTSDNDVNAIKSTSGGLTEGYTVLDFLTSPYAWFIKTNMDGLIHYKRRPFEMDMDTDFTTENLLVKGSERYSFGVKGWRGCWGTFPTS